mmetsp:Transcript_16480/g.24323  ORF Transcript_16480/g.24323 Transcript_16480/m.24323 type:complete len:586 (-) Transcript_16480:1061-2818(-)|eukprot:CAMPEP_0194217660 /NCGR_PEP_ID=MMETSP0156-20130528/21920_1 /TAXON_ID=33649 /ORGANISM="Thalassionema nitzschioides, Strain L26-B" /LENGTH=585 /DNA_ID=CAMNT_0038946769 /DNA_START=28 /DNA_END=1785 /DNA_ORIENTATION=+
MKLIVNRSILIGAALTLGLSLSTDAFHFVTQPRPTATSLYMGMSRKARREQERLDQKMEKKNKKFRDTLENETSEDNPEDNPQQGVAMVNTNPEPDEVFGDDRPDISQFVLDPETKMKKLIPGKFVMDPISRKPVELHADPVARLAQMFPGVTKDVRQQHRLNFPDIEVPDIIEKFRAACEVNGELPKFPSVSQKGIDFVAANYDLLGRRFTRTLTRLKMRSAWLKEKENIVKYRSLLHHYYLIDNYLHAPFRQISVDAENRLGPNFGNLDVASYVGKEIYERTAAYIVLKGMQCTWEKKLRDANLIEQLDGERNPDNWYTTLAIGDPRRFQPQTDTIWELKDCSAICARSIEMVKAFVKDPNLYDGLPAELRFLEDALSVKGGAALRKYMVEEFCPKEGITPESLREGMRRLMQQIHQLSNDPYMDIWQVISKLHKAMCVGTDDAKCPYEPYINNPSKDSPGYFQTYTFNSDPNGLVAFMDESLGEAQKVEVPQKQESTPQAVDNPFESIDKLQESLEIFVEEFGQSPDDRGVQIMSAEGAEYIPPKERALNRPHDLGWYEDLLKLWDSDPKGAYGEVPAGKII